MYKIFQNNDGTFTILLNGELIQVEKITFREGLINTEEGAIYSLASPIQATILLSNGTTIYDVQVIKPI